MRSLHVHDLQHLARGAAILGSGGGGDPAYEILMARHQMEVFGPVKLLSVSEIPDDCLVVPVAFMGAPLIGSERIASGQEFPAIFRAIREKFPGRTIVLMPAEIGGANAFTPLCIAGKLGLPVLDADIIGRAFPELPMSVCNLHGISPTPAWVASALGECREIAAGDAAILESEGRAITVAFGSSAAIACYLMSGAQAKQVVVQGSLSQAIDLGKSWGVQHTSPLASGRIVEVAQEVRDGFLDGFVRLDTGAAIFYRNEYLLATQGEKVLAATPDLIILLEKDSGAPITSESLRYGLRVHVCTLPAPAIWKSEAGMKLVGPEVLCSQWV